MLLYQQLFFNQHAVHQARQQEQEDGRCCQVAAKANRKPQAHQQKAGIPRVPDVMVWPAGLQLGSGSDLNVTGILRL